MNIEFDKVGTEYRNSCEVKDIRTAWGIILHNRSS